MGVLVLLCHAPGRLRDAGALFVSADTRTGTLLLLLDWTIKQKLDMTSRVGIWEPGEICSRMPPVQIEGGSMKRILAVSLVVVLALAGSAEAASPKVPSMTAFRNLEKKVRYLSEQTNLLVKQVKLQQKQIREEESRTSVLSGESGLLTSSGSVELRSPGATLRLNSEGLSVFGPTLSTATTIYFNRYACSSLPVLLSGTGGKTYRSSTFFSC